jgi:hypothetical protein
MFWSKLFCGLQILKQSSVCRNMVTSNSYSISSYNINNIKNSSIKIIRLNNETFFNITRKPQVGYDERYNSSQDNSEAVYEINKNYYKKLLLDKLLDDNIPMMSKIQLLIDNNYLMKENKNVNITTGGLFDDYNYDF